MIMLLMAEIHLGFTMRILKSYVIKYRKIIVTGTRAEELQLRLKLAEVDVPIILEKIFIKLQL